MSMEEGAAGRYRAFVSYSHADEAAAGRIYRDLELYRIPKRLVGQTTRLGVVPRRLAPIFRDRDELPASDDLSSRIKDALSGSSAMIVICSPAARASAWVAREIAAFRELCPGCPIFAALIEGEPATAFPEGLSPRDAAGVEPVAADFRKGKDGRRLARLKLVAGLTGLELDALVQRDAQREIRRVTAVTLVALAAVLIMAFLLVLAVNARREAERQRSEAEGLVEFMLTDLRTDLKGVGSLKVMEAVNRRAIAYYGDQQALGSLPDDSLERRARILHAMGEDDVRRSDFSGALARFKEASVATAATLGRHPDDAKAVFADAQSDYWIGHVHELRKQWAPAERYYALYAAAGRRLIALEPGNPDYMMERGWGPLNLGVVRLNGVKDSVTAERLFREAISWFDKAAQARPADESPPQEKANAYGWLADSLFARSRWSESLAARQAQYRIVERFYRADPENAQKTYQLAIAERSVAHLSALVGDSTAATTSFLKAHERSTALVARDPSNADWLLLNAKIECDLLDLPQARSGAISETELRRSARAAGAVLAAQDNPRVFELTPCLRLPGGENQGKQQETIHG